MWLTGNPPSIMPVRREFGLVCRTVPQPTVCQNARGRRPLHTASGGPIHVLSRGRAEHRWLLPGNTFPSRRRSPALCVVTLLAAEGLPEVLLRTLRGGP